MYLTQGSFVGKTGPMDPARKIPDHPKFEEKSYPNPWREDRNLKIMHQKMDKNHLALTSPTFKGSLLSTTSESDQLNVRNQRYLAVSYIHKFSLSPSDYIRNGQAGGGLQARQVGQLGKRRAQESKSFDKHITVIFRGWELSKLSWTLRARRNLKRIGITMLSQRLTPIPWPLIWRVRSLPSDKALRKHRTGLSLVNLPRLPKIIWSWNQSH